MKISQHFFPAESHLMGVEDSFPPKIMRCSKEYDDQLAKKDDKDVKT